MTIRSSSSLPQFVPPVVLSDPKAQGMRRTTFSPPRWPPIRPAAQMTTLLPLWRSCFHRSRGAQRQSMRAIVSVPTPGLYICPRRPRHAAFLRPQNRRPSIDGWGVGRNRRGGSHRGSPCPVLSAELAISRIPTSCFARAVVPTRTEGARFASSLAGSHARPGFLGAGGFPFRDPEVQRDTRSR